MRNQHLSQPPGLHNLRQRRLCPEPSPGTPFLSVLTCGALGAWVDQRCCGVWWRGRSPTVHNCRSARFSTTLCNPPLEVHNNSSICSLRSQPAMPDNVAVSTRPPHMPGSKPPSVTDVFELGAVIGIGSYGRFQHNSVLCRKACDPFCCVSFYCCFCCGLMCPMFFFLLSVR